jgi:Tfp pilus assembly protein PilF
VNRTCSRNSAAVQAHRAAVAGWLLAGAVAVVLAATASGVLAQASAPAAAATPAAAASAASVRAEVGKPLQAAQDAAKAGNYKEALARVAEAEALPGLTPYERYITQRIKGPAALGAGELALAMASFEAVLASPLLPAVDRTPITETTVKLLLQQKDYARAAGLMKTYLADGGNSPEMRRLYPQVLSVQGDHAGVLRELAPLVAADAAAKRSTPEALLRMLAASQSALKDMPAYIATLEQLASSTGKPEYWAELIARTGRRDGFADERLRLDVYRLRRATGVPLDAGELGDMAERAQQAGLPAEAQALLDKGFASGLLGQDANAAADKKLQAASTKAAALDQTGLAEGEASALKAKDGNAAVNLGLALSATGAHARALALMTQGQAKGGLRRPDDAWLHLGLAQWRAGKIDDAKASFAAAKGADGVADLARLWLLYLGSPIRS